MWVVRIMIKKPFNGTGTDVGLADLPVGCVGMMSQGPIVARALIG